MELTPQEWFLGVLSQEKALALTACQAALEAANKELRELFTTHAVQVQDLHGRIFHEAHRRGWYETAAAGDYAIDTLLNTWQKKIDREPALAPLR